MPKARKISGIEFHLPRVYTPCQVGSETGLRGRSRNRKESEFFWWRRNWIPNNTGSRSRIFVRLRLQISNWIIFYITLLNWEFLLKWYNSFWHFCWHRDYLLCTTIPIASAKFHSLGVKQSEILERSQSGFGVGNFRKTESEILERA